MITLKVIIETIEQICKELKINQQIRPGPKSTYQNSYFITLIILKSLFGFSSETSFLRFLATNRLPGLKAVPEQSWYNRKAKKLTSQVDQVRLLLLGKLGATKIQIRVVDSVPVPVITYARASRCKSFTHKKDASLGYCAATKTKYFGQKLTILVTPEGIPTNYQTSLAHQHDVTVFKQMLKSHTYQQIRFVGDKGYLMKQSDQQQLLESNHCQLVTPVRKNQKKQLTPPDKQVLKKRKIIETVNSQLVDQMDVKRTRAKSLLGLQTRIAGIMLTMTFGMYFNQLFGRNILSLKSILT